MAPIAARIERLLQRLEGEEGIGRGWLLGELTGVRDGVREVERGRGRTEARWREAERALEESEARLARLHDQQEARAQRALSARKRLEQDLFQDRKMEALGRLASGIAHDFNNLLMGIMGCCRLAEQKLEPEAPARLYIEEMRAGAERGTALTRQLLSFSRKRPVQARSVHLNAVLRDAEELLRQLLGEHIACELVLADADPQIVADPGQIEQILMNLVVNARDAMPGGGSLSIETENVILDAAALLARPSRRPGGYARLSVRDSGQGMDDEILAHVFEPFFTTKHGGQGTGLGLATVYGVVSQLGGFIHIDSQVGEGTTFALYFPRSDGC